MKINYAKEILLTGMKYFTDLYAIGTALPCLKVIYISVKIMVSGTPAGFFEML